MKKLIAKKLTKEVIEKSLEVVQKMEEKKPVTKRNASKKVFVIKCGKCKKKKGDGENCCKCGRPWFDGKDIPTVLSKLESAFKFGTTIIRACNYADITRKSFDRYCEKNPEFREKVDRWMENLGMVVDQQVYTAVANGDKEMIRFAAERRDSGRYMLKQGVISEKTDNGILTDDLMKAMSQAAGIDYVPDPEEDEKVEDYENSDDLN